MQISVNRLNDTILEVGAETGIDLRAGSFSTTKSALLKTDTAEIYREFWRNESMASSKRKSEIPLLFKQACCNIE